MQRTVFSLALFLAACSETPGATAPSANTAGSGTGLPTAGTSGATAGSAATSPQPSAAGTSAPGGAGGSAPTATAATAGSGVTAGAGTAAGAGGIGAANPTAGSGGSGSSAPAAGGSAAGSSSAAGSGGVAGSADIGCKDALLCETFEDGTALDPARWESVAPNCMGDAEAGLDAQVARSGKQSARVRAAGGYCNHLFLTPKLTAALPGHLFGRLYVRFERPLTAAHVTFLAMLDATDNKDLRMGGQSEILMWNRESDDATLPELSPTGIALSRKPAAQAWLCVEFEVDAATQTLRTWVDGELVPGLQVEGDATPDVDSQWKRKADWAPKLQNLKLGWESYGDQANTVWFDDVALGTARLGCTGAP